MSIYPEALCDLLLRSAELSPRSLQEEICDKTQSRWGAEAVLVTACVQQPAYPARLLATEVCPPGFAWCHFSCGESSQICRVGGKILGATIRIHVEAGGSVSPGFFLFRREAD